jgi:hypothetical protein
MVLALGASAGIAAPQKDGGSVASGGFQIGGMLTDATTGAPLAHARVAAALVTKRNDVSTITTDEDGRFLFTNLAPGKYTLSAQARGYVSQSFNQHDQYATSIAVGPDLDSSGLLFRLPREGAITGVVTDEAGEGVRDAQVALYFTGLSAGVAATILRGQTMTDYQGSYHFSHLAPGRYLIVVEGRPWYAQHGFLPDPVIPGGSTGSSDSTQLDVAYPITFYNGVTEASRATPIVLGRGERATADVTLQPVSALHLSIESEVDPKERGVMWLERRVLDGPPIQVPTQLSGDGKRLELNGIAPGHYTVRIYAAGKFGDQSASTTRDIDLNANGTLDPYSGGNSIVVSAQLRFESEAPHQAFLELLNKKTREVLSERVTGNGDLVFKQGPVAGSYEVSLANAEGIYLKSISVTGAKVSGRTLEIGAEATVKLTIAAARGVGEVGGVASRDGWPFGGAMIVLVPADPAHNEMLFRRDQSDSDGTFTLPGVVPGVYTALAIEDGWELEWKNPEVLRNYMSRGVAVRVQPKGKYDIKVAVQLPRN